MRKHALDILKLICDNDWWDRNTPTIVKETHTGLFMARIHYYFQNIEPDLVIGSPFYFLQLQEEIKHLILEINERYPDLI